MNGDGRGRRRLLVVRWASPPQPLTAIARGQGQAWRPQGVAAARTALGHLGYVRRPETEPMWEAGIPSLMSYVQQYVPAPNASSDSVQ